MRKLPSTVQKDEDIPASESESSSEKEKQDSESSDSENALEIKLNRFDFKQLPLDAFVLIIGKRRYGKSTWAEWLLSNVWQYYPDGGYVFTKTKQNHFWSKHFPEERIYQGFPEEVVEGIIKDQERKYERILNGEKLIPFIVILLDDIIAGHDLRYNNELWEHLVFSGRHLFALVILCTQDVKGIGPDTRHNSDIIAMTYQTQKRSIESIEQDYASLLMTSATDKARLNPLDFYKFVQRNTKNHKMLVCDQTSAKYELKEVFFWDQAPDPKKTDLKFKIGDEQFWREAGCDWKAQLKKHKNAPSNKEKDDWKKEAKKRWKKEKEEKSWRVQREESKLEINQPFFADRKYRAMMMEEQKREIGKSHVQQAAERIRNVAKFIPGPKTSDRQY